MTYWIKELGVYHSMMRHAHPDDPLLVIFDIDDTILDLRHAVRHVLGSFDRHHGTRFFIGLTEDVVSGDDTDLPRLIGGLPISKYQGKRASDWCSRYFWSTAAIVEAHVPFPRSGGGNSMAPEPA